MADAADGEEIFDALETPALFPHVDNSLRRDGADTGQFLKFFYICEIQIDRFRGRMLFSTRGMTGQEKKTNEKQYRDSSL